MGEQHLGGTPEGASLIAHVGDRVMTREGFPGVVTDTHEGLGPDTTYWVTLDNGMGGGEYGEAEISPINSRDASVERTAADDYPELGSILVDRPPIRPTVPASEYFGGRVLAHKVATSDEARDWDDAGAHEDMDGEEYVDPPYPEDKTAVAKCKCCGGAGEHDDGHECYVCDASGDAAESKGEVCEGHHGRPDHSELSAERGVHHEGAVVEPTLIKDDPSKNDFHAVDEAAKETMGGILTNHRKHNGIFFVDTCPECIKAYGPGGFKTAAAKVHCADCGQNYFVDSKADVEAHHDSHKTADLYLPLDDTSPTTVAVPRDLDEGERPGFTDGWHDATTTAVKSPKSDDGHYRSGYDLGWAHGLKYVAPAKPSIEAENELEQRLSSVDLGMPGLRTEAGFFDFMTGSPAPSENFAGQGSNWSFDWCRFRKNSHCFYPKHLDEAATKQAGYAVWIPEDRGNCPRVKWDDQKVCPVGEPGPHVPGGFTDATVPWEAGGQHGGRPDPAYNAPSETFSPLASKQAGLDTEAAFHFLATWADVRNKAKRIRSSGGVRILAVREGQITGQVQGDTNVYQSTLTSVPGKYAVAYWECGCAWAAYAWGRSPAFARFEGRMCSHALALNYEAQARSMFGKTIHEDAKTPAWMDTTIPVKVPGDYDRNKGRHSSMSNLHTVEAAYLAEDYDEASPLSLMRQAAISKPFAAKIMSSIVMLFVQPQGITDQNGKVVTELNLVYYPTYDPHLGLSLADRVAILHDEWALTSEAADEWKIDCNMCRKEGAPVLGSMGNLECRYCGSANVKRTATIEGEMTTTSSDDEWGMLLPGEPSYDANPVVWAGPSGQVHGDLFEDALDVPSVDDEPEPALPETYGDDDEMDALASVRAALEGEASFFHPTPAPRTLTLDEMREEQERVAREAEEEQRKERQAQASTDPAVLLAQHQARLAAEAVGQEVAAPDPFAHLMTGSDNKDTAAAAQAFLAKAGMADFSAAERSQIIDEGVDGEGASNLDGLDITGTHYEALERRRAAQPDDDDLSFWG